MYKIDSLGNSQCTCMKAVESQESKDLMRVHKGRQSYFGVVSEAVVYDHLKKTVAKSSSYEPVLSTNASAFGLHYNTNDLAQSPASKSNVLQTD